MGAGSHRLARLPPWVNHWLGYRPQELPPPSDLIICIWAFVGAFVSLALLQGIFQSQYFVDRNVPSVVASFVRIVYSLTSPFADSRIGRKRSIGLWCHRFTFRSTSSRHLRTFHCGICWNSSHQSVHSERLPRKVQ